MRKAPVVDTVLDILPEDEAGLLVEDELGKGETVKGGSKESSQLHQLLLVCSHWQAGVVDNKYLRLVTVKI
jgi:hypothetical protein